MILLDSWYLGGEDMYNFFNEQVQTSNVELMNSSCDSSGSFGSIGRSKYIVHNTYTDRKIHICSKPTPIHGPFHKSDLNYSYSRSHFSWLTQAVAKELINQLSRKNRYAYMKIDTGINEFSSNELKSYLYIWDHSIVNFVII